MAKLFVDRIEFKLDGELVRITTTSGKSQHEVVAKFRHFRRRTADAAAIIAKHDARAADVVGIGKAKR